MLVKNNMKYSFVIIAYNEEYTISHCLDSILKQQELSDYEIIVINDGSNDQTAKIVFEYSNKYKQIKLISLSPNQGRGFARKQGIKSSSGKFIAFIDADITLPINWLSICMKQINQYDAVGGIAIPDGDSTYICQKFKLRPKLLPHTNGITGSNSIYKRKIFEKINFNSRLRDGEDSDILVKMVHSKYKVKLINSLIVKHQEDINFTKSIKRMFSFGKSATKLLINHKKIRIPDISFFIFIVVLVISIFFLVYGNVKIIYLPIIYILFVSYLHLYRKFELYEISPFILGGLVNYFMISSYYAGRMAGIFTKK